MSELSPWSCERCGVLELHTDYWELYWCVVRIINCARDAPIAQALREWSDEKQAEIAELKRKLAEKEQAAPSGLPKVGAPIELWVAGWQRDVVKDTNEAIGEGVAESGCTFHVANEGKYWRRVQPDAKPSEKCEHPASHRGGGCDSSGKVVEERCGKCGTVLSGGELSASSTDERLAEAAARAANKWRDPISPMAYGFVSKPGEKLRQAVVAYLAARASGRRDQESPAFEAMEQAAKEEP